GLPNSTHASMPNRPSPPAKITGLRRPSRSEMKPSKGQPIIQPNGTVAANVTAASYSRPRASCRKRTPQVIPKIVVGINSRPETKPQRIDCGFTKTVFNDLSITDQPPVPGAAAFGASFGRNANKHAATTSPTTPA